MKISISATNPCHLYDMARELARLDALGCYYSGYPQWKLANAEQIAIRTHSFRTTIVYALLKLPEKFRPSARSLFLWQDHSFDRWVGRNLRPCEFIHAMPGQALHTLKKAKQLGIATVLNHATGPVREWVRIMEPEYARAGLRLADVCPFDDAYFAREDEEYALADFHCVASSVVRDQLVACGIAPSKIWIVPYGADRTVFFPPEQTATHHFRIVFAGQLSLRKDMRTLLRALELLNRADWEMHFYGGIAGEVRADLENYHGATPLTFHGAVSQRTLADAFRAGSVLVLPSLEEGFGLVVPQALNCGMPCLVSDCVGAKDLIEHHRNGSIFPAKNATALADELIFWEKNRTRPADVLDWCKPAQMLVSASFAALASLRK